MPIRVADVGEFGLIARLTARLAPALGVPATVLGPGDDAAVVRAPDGRVVASTDLLVEGQHFRRDWSTAGDVGRKAAAQNLADVAAMGAVPTALLVGLAVPPDLSLDWVDGLADGLRDECAPLGAGVVGGDVVRSDRVTIAVTALGDLQGRAPVTRAGARAGDRVVVAGRLGAAAAGLAVLRRGEPALLTAHPALVDAHRRPTPPYAAGPALADLGATAMADVSDGLLADVGHIAADSGVAVDLARARLVGWSGPLAAAAADLGRPGAEIDWVLTGGEDHALVATIPNRRPVAGLATVVGTVRAGAGVTVDGEAWTTPGGFDHFAGAD